VAPTCRRFVETEEIRAALAKAVEAELREGKGDPFDSHPPLRERVAAIDALAMPARLADDRRAIELAADVAALESRLAAHLFVKGEELTAVAWEDLGQSVFVPSWRRCVEEHRAQLLGTTAASIVRDPKPLRELTRRCTGTHLWDVPDEAIVRWAVNFFGGVLAIALVERGWLPRKLPGEAVRLEVGSQRFEPFVEMSAFLALTTDRAAWIARMRELGIADVDLGTIAVEAESPPKAP
jgi:hypothetical protein